VRRSPSFSEGTLKSHRPNLEGLELFFDSIASSLYTVFALNAMCNVSGFLRIAWLLDQPTQLTNRTCGGVPVVS
jgi:hypothetical protein